ncbi:cytochrome P450 [Backusella circina FSU 941]|nr:cytochrome P450 [Backusella circina FSU 941]
MDPLVDSVFIINSTLNTGTKILPVTAALLVGSFGWYLFKRYTSALALVPLAPANNFWLKHFGIVPPPSDADTEDLLSEFLIKTGQDPKMSPISVCWSVTAKPLVIVSTLKGIKDVLIDGQVKSKIKGVSSKVQRGNLIRLIQNLVFGGKNLNNTIGEEWRWRRHILLPPFQPKQLVPKLLPYVANRATQVLSAFEKSAESNEYIELDSLFMDMTMDVINFYLYGRSELNYDSVGSRSNLKDIHHHLGLGFQSIEAWLPFGLNKTKWAQRSYKPAQDILKRFIEDALELALSDYRKDLEEYEVNDVPEKQRVYKSVAAIAAASKKYGDDHFDLINDLLSLTFAGYDTTAHTLAFTFSELARNPELQEQLFQQVRSVLGPPPVDPSNITSEKLAQMPLVTAVYRETLRKYPAVVFIPVHVNSDITVDGAVVPAESEIWCNVRGVQMDPSIFPNPEKYDPSRFLRPQDSPSSDSAFDSLDPETRYNKEVTPETQYNFPDLAFTLGQHACLGKNLAILELRTVIACVMNQFTCSLKPDCVVSTQVVLTTKPRNGVWVKFNKRE